MNIAMLGPFGLRPKSTVSRRVLPLGRALAARGHRVTVIVPTWDWPADAGRVWHDNGVEIRCLRLAPPVPGLSQAMLLVRLVRAALSLQSDVIHCFKPKAFTGLAALLLWYGRGAGLWAGRLVLDSDDWEGAGGWNERAGYSSVERLFFAWQERWGPNHVDAVTVASHTLQSLAWSRGVPSHRVHYLPNGPFPLAAGRGERGSLRQSLGLGDDPLILCYTRFLGCGPRRWAAIVAETASRAPSARFLVVGTGLSGEEREFWEQVDRQQLAERITLTGWVQEEELLGYMAAADLALFPLDDSLLNRARCPAKLADLLSIGTPVLAEAVGEAAVYIEDGVSGALMLPGSEPATWGAAATSLLENESRRRQMGAAALRRMQDVFSWDRLAERLLAVYAD
jgi:glycosyltransferase involved in cell wall biosynthesis